MTKKKRAQKQPEFLPFTISYSLHKWGGVVIGTTGASYAAFDSGHDAVAYLRKVADSIESAVSANGEPK